MRQGYGGTEPEKLLRGQLGYPGLARTWVASPNTRETDDSIRFKLCPYAMHPKAVGGKAVGAVCGKKIPRGGEKGYFADRIGDTRKASGKSTT